MRFPKWIFLFVFVAGAFLGKPIALSFVGLITKAYLFFEFGWQFSYNGVDWKEGHLVFHAIHLKEKGTLDLEAKEASLFFQTHHVQVDHPTVFLTGIPKQKTDLWTISMQEGIFRGGEGLEGVCFSFEKLWPHHLGRFHLSKNGSTAQIEIVEEGNEICFDATLEQFDARHLKYVVDLQGKIEGNVHLVFEKNKSKRGSAHIQVQDAGFKKLVSGIDATLDWEGSLNADWIPKYEDSRMRLLMTKGTLASGEGGVENLKGNCSFTAGVGAKWEFEGQAKLDDKKSPISFLGKAFIHPLRSSWVESKAACGETFFSMKGKEEGNLFLCEWAAEHLDPFSFMWAESFFATLNPKWEKIEFEKGRLEVQGKGSFLKTEMKEWELSVIADRPDCHYGTHAMQCEFASAFFSSKNGINGDFSIEGFSFQEKWSDHKTIFGDQWKGIGSVRGGCLEKTHLEGTIGGLDLSLSVEGTLNDFQISALGKHGDLQLVAKREDEKLHFSIAEGSYDGFSFQGIGWIDWEGRYFCHLDHFEGAISPLYHAIGGKEKIQGEIFSIGEGVQITGNRNSFDLFVQAKGKIEPNIPFHIAFLEKQEDLWGFDLRLDMPFWDLARLYGTFKEGVFSFDLEKTHFLGKPLQIEHCVLEEGGFKTFSLQTELSWKTLMAAVPQWIHQIDRFVFLPIDGEALLRLSFEKEKGSTFSLEGQNLFWQEKPLSFKAEIQEQKEGWNISSLKLNQYQISATLQKEPSSFRIMNGSISGGGISMTAEGKIDKDLQYEFLIPHISCDLKELKPFFPNLPLLGVLEGKGRVLSKEKLEAGFDLTCSNFEAFCVHWTLRDALRVSYASDTGFLFEGIKAYGKKDDEIEFPLEIGRLQLELPHLLWTMKHARIELPAHVFKCFSQKSEFLKYFDPEEEIHFTLDELQCPFDFSSFSCSIDALSLPMRGNCHELRNISLLFDDEVMNSHFQLIYEEKPIWITSRFSFNPQMSGRVTLEDERHLLEENERPLAISWSHCKEGIFIHEIEGKFSGIDASFHLLDEESALIGSARINFRELADWIPEKIKTLFQALKMGNGYELKGKLSVNKGRPSFQGLLSGKQIGLFGFQFRTLLSQIELSPEKFHLYDFKVSDSAGILKIDELLAQKSDTWTLMIPDLTVLELRPSLLQRDEDIAPPSTAGPLVIREIKVKDFNGILENPQTYTAKGKIEFINSYRREHTLFDLPSDVLGRLVGLDLDLLIPTRGELQCELKEGAVYLTSLQDAYSEGKRSEFFLVTDPPPMMDLNGNLSIIITMKQFVLFKLTESFQIVVDGNITDPKYHLQKKKRFLGF